MSDVPSDPHSPAEEDPVVHQHLVLLPAFSPRPGLADRVLIHVRLPIPRWLTQVETRWRDLVASRRIWLYAAPFIVGTLAFVVTLTVAIVTHATSVRTAVGVVIEHGVLVAARVALEVVRRHWATLTQSWGAFAAVPWAAVALAAVALWAACAWGLYRTMRVAVPVRKTVHAKR